MKFYLSKTILFISLLVLFAGCGGSSDPVEEQSYTKVYDGYLSDANGLALSNGNFMVTFTIMGHPSFKIYSSDGDEVITFFDGSDAANSMDTMYGEIQTVQLTDGTIVLMSSIASEGFFLFNENGEKISEKKFATDEIFMISNLSVGELSNGTFVIAYSTHKDGRQVGEFRVFNNIGEQVGDAAMFGAESTMGVDRLRVSGLSSGKFILAYRCYDNIGIKVKFQRFNNDGSTDMSEPYELFSNNNNGSDLTGVFVEELNDGNCLFVEKSASSNGQDLRMKVYDVSENILSDAILIENPHEAAGMIAYGVAVLNSGNFLVHYSNSNFESNNSYNVYNSMGQIVSGPSEFTYGQMDSPVNKGIHSVLLENDQILLLGRHIEMDENSQVIFDAFCFSINNVTE